jgi:hypothetical protein
MILEYFTACICYNITGWTYNRWRFSNGLGLYSLPGLSDTLDGTSPWLSRLRRKIPEKGSVAGTVAEDRQPAIVMNDNSHKIEKKKAKAVAKRAKKAGRS